MDPVLVRLIGALAILVVWFSAIVSCFAQSESGHIQTNGSQEPKVSTYISQSHEAQLTRTGRMDCQVVRYGIH